MLIGNGSRWRSNPMRVMGGQSVINDMIVPGVNPGALQNQSTAFGILAATPAGYYIGSAWIYPKKAGAMSSTNACIFVISDSGAGALGFTFTGTSTSFEFMVSGTAGLIMSAIASGTFTITANADIVALFGAVASGTFSINASGTSGALGFLVANSDITLFPDLISYAFGWMSGTTEDTSTVTPTTVAQAVWNALSADFDTPGTMAELLQAAGAGGNPWVEEIENNYNAKEALRLMLSALVGKASGAGTTSIAFRDVNDTKDRIVATVDGIGNRTDVVKNVS